jgi:hypothetical protein
VKLPLAPLAGYLSAHGPVARPLTMSNCSSEPFGIVTVWMLAMLRSAAVQELGSASLRMLGLSFDRDQKSNAPTSSIYVIAILARLPLVMAPPHLVELRVPRVTKDLEIDRCCCITVKGIVHRLLGQVGDSMAQPAEKLCHHAAVTRLRNFFYVRRRYPDCNRQLSAPYRIWDAWSV